MSLKRFAKERAKDKAAKRMTAAGEAVDREVNSYVRRKKIVIPSLPFNLKRLSVIAEQYDERPAAILFPYRMLSLQFAAFFIMSAASFALMKSYLIILALPLLIFGVIYNSFTLKIAKALMLSAAKARIFSAVLFVAGAASGLLLRQFIFGKGW
ncbi:MAG: hypothetical protein IKN38_03955 [Clostridia bacterium]|nr:hypothetical protein [Clostridia bacterium]